MKKIRKSSLFLPGAAFVMGMLILPVNASAAEEETTDETTDAESAVQTETPDSESTDNAETFEEGWQEVSGGRKYFNNDGTYLTGEVSIDNVVYILDDEGFQQTGWQTSEGKRHYYDPKTGEAAIGGKEIDGTVYLFD
ncbi:MAG: hypothetical protein ACI4JN_08325, partial [Ruminococcus sp.]